MWFVSRVKRYKFDMFFTAISTYNTLGYFISGKKKLGTAAKSNLRWITLGVGPNGDFDLLLKTGQTLNFLAAYKVVYTTVMIIYIVLQVMIIEIDK